MNEHTDPTTCATVPDAVGAAEPIVVAVDVRSDAAERRSRLLAEARSLSLRTGRPVHLVCAVQGGDRRAALERTDDVLRRLAASLRVPTTWAVVPGEPSDVLAAEAARLGAAIVLVGNLRPGRSTGATRSMAAEVRSAVRGSVMVVDTGR